MTKASVIATNVRRAFELGAALDEEERKPDTGTATEPAVKLDAEAQRAVRAATAMLAEMEKDLTALGYSLEGQVGKTSRPDGMRDTITDLSALRQKISGIRQRIVSRFKTATVDRSNDD
jgi:hypothetical protein